MDKQDIKDSNEKFPKAAMEVLESSQLSPPSAPATVPAPPPKISTSLTKAVQSQSAGRKHKKLKIFLCFYERIYELVDDPSTDSFISWGKRNRSFVVTNPEELVLRNILPRFYCTTLEKFIKRLKYKGFKEIKRSGNVLEFGNRNFVRGKPERMVEMHKNAMMATTFEIRIQAKAKPEVEVVDRLQNLRI